MILLAARLPGEVFCGFRVVSNNVKTPSVSLKEILIDVNNKLTITNTQHITDLVRK